MPKKKVFKNPAEQVHAFEGRSAAEINAEIAKWKKGVGDIEIVAQEVVPHDPPVVMVYYRPRPKAIVLGLGSRRR